MVVVLAAGVSFAVLVLLWAGANNITGSMEVIDVVVPLTAWWLLFTIPGFLLGLVGGRRPKALAVALGLMAIGAASACASYGTATVPSAPTGRGIPESVAGGAERLESDMRGAAEVAWPSATYTLDGPERWGPCEDNLHRTRGAARSRVHLEVPIEVVAQSNVATFVAELERRGWEARTDEVDVNPPDEVNRFGVLAIVPRGPDVDSDAPYGSADAYVMTNSVVPGEYLLIEGHTPCLRDLSLTNGR